jgi:hypothetical protein
MNRLLHLFGWAGAALLLAAVPGRAQTPVWSDNFDNGANWTSTAVWKIGSPTAGPPVNTAGYRTHSGANCAYTQGYGYDKDTRLICESYNGASSLAVPSADQAPRLRFWHWFNFGNALGYVEISTNGGSAWIQISPTYENINSGGVWSRPSISLGAYAGENIKIAFHFTSGGCCGNGLGWFVDDVEVDDGPETLNFPEGFEFDPKTNDWSEDFGTWQIGSPTVGPPVNTAGYRTHTGTNCAGTGLTQPYANNVDSRLISPGFVVPATNGANGITLRFSQWYSYNGLTTVTTTTNTVITTNVTATLNTNLYQLFEAAIADYTNVMSWNPAIGGWTNATKALGSVRDQGLSEQFYFEAGTAPLALLIGDNSDYRINYPNLPSPQSATPTNFIAMQGATWASIAGTDLPIGYFGTNYSYTYTTNTTIVVNQSTWTQISPTYMNATTGGVWTNASVDLSAYAGQAIQLGFHFTSGGIDTAAGWYVDDLTLVAPPILAVPTNLVMFAGETLTVTNAAADPYMPSDTNFIFKLLLPHPAGMSMTTQGILTWTTSPLQPSSTNTITVEVTDNDVQLSTTNSFVVTVLNTNLPDLIVPPAQTIYVGQTLTVTLSATNDFNPDDTFTFDLVSTTLTNVDVSDLPVDGVINWYTPTTQKAGTYQAVVEVTDAAGYSATNSFQIIVSNAPAPVLSLPPAQTIYAGQLLDLFITATNPAFPDSVFTYTLTNPPAGVLLDPNTGELTWQTDPTNKTHSVTTISVVVMDDNKPPLTASGSFKVTFLPTPVPTLVMPPTQTNYAGQQLAVTISATNVALPNAVYTFALTAASTNFFITNSSDTSAVLTWTNTGIKNNVLYWTNNSVSPRTNTINVWVQDNTTGWANRTTNHFALVFLPPLPPHLCLPTNETIFVGQTFANVLAATNDFLPGTNFTLASVCTNGLLLTNMLTWTNAAALPGVYPVYVKITDDSVLPLHATNNFLVTVLPYPSQLVLTNIAFPTNGGKKFTFSIKTPWTNTPWRIEAATNLAAAGTNWVPIFTNKTAPGSTVLFTDRLATNYLQRYYRAVFP